MGNRELKLVALGEGGGGPHLLSLLRPGSEAGNCPKLVCKWNCMGQRGGHESGWLCAHQESDLRERLWLVRCHEVFRRTKGRFEDSPHKRKWLTTCCQPALHGPNVGCPGYFTFKKDIAQFSGGSLEIRKIFV